MVPFLMRRLRATPMIDLWWKHVEPPNTRFRNLIKLLSVLWNSNSSPHGRLLEGGKSEDYSNLKTLRIRR